MRSWCLSHSCHILKDRSMSLCSPDLLMAMIVNKRSISKVNELSCCKCKIGIMYFENQTQQGVGAKKLNCLWVRARDIQQSMES